MEISLLADYPKDSKKIAQWYYHEWGHRNPNVSLEVIYNDVAAKAMNRQGVPLFFVVHEHQEVVGVAELKLRENKNYPEYEHWLGGVFVSPKHRGNGYGTALILRVLAYASELEIKNVYLQCEAHNVPLYQKHNFIVLHKSESSTIMVRHSEA